MANTYYLFAHTGEGHSEAELKTEKHTEAATQAADSTVEKTTTIQVSETKQNPAVNDSPVFALIFVSVIVAAVIVGAVALIKNRSPKADS